MRLGQKMGLVLDKQRLFSLRSEQQIRQPPPQIEELCFEEVYFAREMTGCSMHIVLRSSLASLPTGFLLFPKTALKNIL